MPTGGTGNSSILLKTFQRYTRFDKQLRYQCVVVVILVKTNRPNARRQQQFCAMDAGEMRHVGGGVLYRNPAARRIGNRVLFRMHRQLFVIIAYHGSVRQFRQKAVVAGSDDALFLRDQDATDV